MIMFKLLTDAVQEDYRNCRLEGQSRSDAIDTLKQKYYDELNDDDESAIVMSGLVLALCKKRN